MTSSIKRIRRPSPPSGPARRPTTWTPPRVRSSRTQGYGEFFIHRTGHGIGLDDHETPYILSGNYTKLQPGHCFSVEPGVYLPGKFGVRLENILTVTDDGTARVFNEAIPPELTIL